MNEYLQDGINAMIDIMETIIIALALFVITYLFAFQPHEVIGQSMDGIDNFHEGQYILTDKVTYRFREPARGEVIVFKFPLNKSYDYIKRIIGLPGEEIMIKDGKVTIYNQEHPDGIILDESQYLAASVITDGKNFLKEGEKKKIPENQYVVFGDNRPESSDSRSWGFLPKEDIIGRSYFRYWPSNEIGLIRHPEYKLE